MLQSFGFPAAREFPEPPIILQSSDNIGFLLLTVKLARLSSAFVARLVRVVVLYVDKEKVGAINEEKVDAINKEKAGLNCEEEMRKRCRQEKDCCKKTVKDVACP